MFAHHAFINTYLLLCFWRNKGEGMSKFNTNSSHYYWFFCLCFFSTFIAQWGAFPVFNFSPKYSYLFFLKEFLNFTCILHVWVPGCGYVYQIWTWFFQGPEEMIGASRYVDMQWAAIWMVRKKSAFFFFVLFSPWN